MQSQTLSDGSLLQEGKYKVDRTLGQGGFGITYMATQDILERKVAIKEFFFREYCERNGETSHVTLGTQSNRETVERFLNKFIKEARTISKLHHPAIISIYDIFREKGTAYYVMEYIEGESLGDMVKRRGFIPQNEALSYIRSVGDALAYIHQRNINHLDVKPSNIMLRRTDNQIVLIDFGVAKQYNEQTKEGTTTTPVGISHGYSPAEQYNKNGVQTFSPQSDVYALAATLFKLLTGNTPPQATEIPDTGLPNDELSQKGVTQSVIRAIERAMKPRSIRTQSVEEFLADLESDNDGERVEDNEDTEIVNVVAPNPAPKATPISKTTPAPKPAPAPKSPPKPMRKSLLIPFIVIIGIIISVVLWQRPWEGREGEGTEVIAETEVKNKPMNIPLGECTYTGQVDTLGVPHGQGEAYFKDGRYYQGAFIHGIAEGAKSVFKYENGDMYEGSFVKNGFGQGRYTIKEDGSYFVGTFKDGNPNQGSWYNKSGNPIE